MKKTVKALSITLFLMGMFQSFSFGQEIQNISPIKAKLMARNGSIMVDVRSPEQIKEVAYDVDGIKTIPLDQIPARLDELPKDKKIILACNSGNKSLEAAKILISKGYKEVYNMEGGIIAWQEKKLEVIKNGVASTKSCCSGSKKSCSPNSKCETK